MTALIMFDVKLTPSGRSVDRRLFVWMGRRRAGLIVFSLLSKCSRIAGATSVICLICVLDRLWSRTVSFMLLWIYPYRWDCPYVGFWILYFRLNYIFGPRVLTNSRNWSCPFKTEQSRPCIIIFVAFSVLHPILSSKNDEVSEF